jgi:hypothetical protein
MNCSSEQSHGELGLLSELFQWPVTNHSIAAPPAGDVLIPTPTEQLLHRRRPRPFR